MNTDVYIEFLKNPNELDSNSLDLISKVVEEYPYFNSFWLLYIKNLYLLNDVRYESKLKTAASYVNDRNVLYNLIHKSNENKDSKNKTGFDNKQEVRDDEFSKISKFINTAFEKNKYEKSPLHKLSLSNKKLPGIEKPENTDNLNQISRDAIEKINKHKIDEDRLNEVDAIIDSDILFDYKKEHKERAESEKIPIELSYSDYNPENISSKKEKVSSDSSKSKNQDLIDKFISTQKSKIKGASEVEEPSGSEGLNISEEGGFFTETLAKIYLEQKHFDKALLTYQKLYLKYPEKSIYFAKQIKKLKELINNS